MRTHTIPSIEVTLDVCATHGTWFDASELRIVARHFERKAASDDAAAAAFGAQLTEQRTMDALTVRPLGGWGLFTLDVLLRLLR